MKHTDLTDKEVAGVIDHADASVTSPKLRHPFPFTEFPFTPIGIPGEDYEVTNKYHTDRLAQDATPQYVGLRPQYYLLGVAATWTLWDLRLLVPGPARYVEILHRNHWPDAPIRIGSRKPGTTIDRHVNIAKQSHATWTTELSPARYVELYAQRSMTPFYLVGYWT